MSYIPLIEIFDNELVDVIENFSRFDIIECLILNDRNGVYCIADSLKEFGAVMTKALKYSYAKCKITRW